MALNKNLKKHGITLIFCAAGLGLVSGAPRLDPETPENQKMLENKFPLATGISFDEDFGRLYRQRGHEALQQFVDKRTVKNLMWLGEIGGAVAGVGLLGVGAARLLRRKPGGPKPA